MTLVYSTKLRKIDLAWKKLKLLKKVNKLKNYQKYIINEKYKSLRGTDVYNYKIKGSSKHFVNLIYSLIDF